METLEKKIDVMEGKDSYFLLKELENLGHLTDESDIIKDVFELINTLFSSRQIAYVDYVNDVSGKTVYYNSMDKNYQHADAYNSFTLEIINRGEKLGVIEIYGVSFPENIPAYRKIGSVICSICGLAISNARKYKIIEVQKKQLQISSKQINDLINSKDKFFSIIAHELRGPFGNFMGLTTILADEFSRYSLDEINQITLKMKNSATSLFGLLENLLEWARSQQGLIPFNPEMLDVQTVLKDCITLLLDEISKKDIKIICNLPSELKVYADPKMLQTILRNLIFNGLKFTQKGGKIALTAFIMNDNMVKISIHDTGIGIPDVMLNDLFSVEVKTNRKGTEGELSSGLGLILCKEFIEKNGGNIWVESAEGKGSMFSFTMPAKKKDESG